MFELRVLGGLDLRDDAGTKISAVLVHPKRSAVLVYLAMPVVRILTGAQPLAGATADQFLVHFAPYYAVALGMVAVAGAGAFTFAGFSLATSSFWIHVRASLLALAGRRGSFVVTPKQGELRRQPGAVWPALVIVTILALAAVYGVLTDPSPATVNNVAFAGFHITIMLASTPSTSCAAMSAT